MPKTKLEIINETVEFYSQDVSRRAITVEGCKYITPEGKKCAFGRCMTEESLQKTGQFQGGIGNLLGKLDENYSYKETFQINEPLKEEYQGHEFNFWVNIQGFHDDSAYWNEEGLTELGRERVEYLKRKYKI